MQMVLDIYADTNGIHYNHNKDKKQSDGLCAEQKLKINFDYIA